MKDENRIKKISLDKENTILTAIKRMDDVKSKLLLITSDGDYYSLLSIGDIQRAIINNVGLNTPVHKIVRDKSKITVAKFGLSEKEIKKLVYKAKAEFMPVIDDTGKLVNIFFWEEHFETGIPHYKGLVDVPVVIMAGGKGSRLKPITNIIPKALLPLEDKPIIELIKDRFAMFGSKHFFFMLNYKKEMIKSYFEEKNIKEKIVYISENKPLGTAGSLSLLADKIDKTFFVSNCDIIVNTDYNEIYNYHKENNCEITLVSALKHYSIPYGTLETSKNGFLEKIEEKPELTFLINTGMYVLEPNLLKEVPINRYYHITNLIEYVMKRGGKVGVFPVSEKSWMDIGEWEEYYRSQKMYKDYFIN